VTKFYEAKLNRISFYSIIVSRTGLGNVSCKCTSIIHFYIVHKIVLLTFQEKDLSLKDSAGYCLRKVAPAVSLQYRDAASDVEFLVSDTILCLVRSGIRDKNETVQQESIKLLGEMVSNNIWSCLEVRLITYSET
jgi:hypothetical protein